MPQTIALVDDDRNILTSVAMTLESEGFVVRTFADGAEALRGIQLLIPAEARPPIDDPDEFYDTDLTIASFIGTLGFQSNRS